MYPYISDICNDFVMDCCAKKKYGRDGDGDASDAAVAGVVRRPAALPDADPDADADDAEDAEEGQIDLDRHNKKKLGYGGSGWKKKGGSKHEDGDVLDRIVKACCKLTPPHPGYTFKRLVKTSRRGSKSGGWWSSKKHGNGHKKQSYKHGKTHGGNKYGNPYDKDKHDGGGHGDTCNVDVDGFCEEIVSECCSACTSPDTVCGDACCESSSTTPSCCNGTCVASNDPTCCVLPDEVGLYGLNPFDP